MMLGSVNCGTAWEHKIVEHMITTCASQNIIPDSSPLQCIPWLVHHCSLNIGIVHYYTLYFTPHHIGIVLQDFMWGGGIIGEVIGGQEVLMSLLF